MSATAVPFALHLCDQRVKLFATPETENQKDKLGLSTKGSLLVLALPVVVLILGLLLAVAQLSMRAQNLIALNYRLQSCAHSVIQGRKQLFKKLVVRNRWMKPLRISVLTFRSGRIIPGVGLISAVAARAALIALNLFKVEQELSIFHLSLKEWGKISCGSTPFSRQPSFCRFRVLSRARDLYRQKTLFPDVPGALRLRKSSKSLLTIVCSGLSQSNSLERQKMTLRGSRNLSKENFSHEYK